MTDTAVEVINLSKKFNIYKKPQHRFFEMFSKKKYHDEFWALKNINFKLNKGEALGIVGPNGAGKSTLLKILTGSLWPTTGKCKINGRVVSLLELGTGFHPELTGIQNIYNSTSLLGIEPSIIKKKLDSILDFAGIDEFIDKPLKTYSSGMYVRLAFSLFANLDPDVYIVDEALAVGDVFFQQKCYDKLQQMRDNGVSIIIVSHDSAPIVNYCDYAMIIDKGELRDIGNPAEIVSLYQANEYSKKTLNGNFNILTDSEGVSFGDFSCEITGAKIINDNNKEVFLPGDFVTIQVNFLQHKPLDSLSVGIQLKNRLGSVVYGTNTNWNKINLEVGKPKDNYLCEFKTQLNIGPGEYTLSVAISESKKFVERVYHWRDNFLKFEVLESGDLNFGGQVFLPMEIKMTKN
ncbi:ABC transporter ATP-binding protein [Paenibacillus chitinolyticus]|uniref:ABC transporter ATP-binding protein n=1 Tax=Paenibacillus chitinolyticus TaxID=79263 RepID=UPI001C459BF2|nr:ABC transporter ATP-binding protein [Paenibacillus chitinolyticus]MBV6716008.1 ABC transporter ATP-binding protein [Paenibacillus chitinolyticus]